ncbi:hypothetical protein [Halosimplex salinum]|uniref:hypothetical protein n=1 Tax=Halosimplex salinum TaxID=1710538 RepID=UPI000F47525E|nr:hypothetical protein [Halosimplex salinum]
MTPTRRTVLGTLGASSLAGLGGCSALGGRESTPSCDVACFEFSHERAESGPDTLTVRHAAGRDLPAGEVTVSGIAFDWPPVREPGYAYSWAAMSDLDPSDGIGGRSLRVNPALVDAVRLSWDRDGDPVELDAFRVSTCDRHVACFESIHQGADDNPDHLVVRHVAGRDLPAREVYLTGVASEYPPDPETGRTAAWHELGDIGPGAGVAGETIRVEIGFVDTVSVLWRRDGDESVVEEFRLSGASSE